MRGTPNWFTEAPNFGFPISLLLLSFDKLVGTGVGRSRFTRTHFLNNPSSSDLFKGQKPTSYFEVLSPTSSCLPSLAIYERSSRCSVDPVGWGKSTRQGR